MFRSFRCQYKIVNPCASARRSPEVRLRADSRRRLLVGAPAALPASMSPMETWWAANRSATSDRLRTGSLPRELRFPRPIKLGGHASFWIEEEIDSWLQEQITNSD